jgi:hypothetical protein
MTVIHIHRVKCDACEKEVRVEYASGWLSVEYMVTSEEEAAFLMAKAHATGTSGVFSGNFCSLPCLGSWAMNADKLNSMEGMPVFDPEVDDDPEA